MSLLIVVIGLLMVGGGYIYPLMRMRASESWVKTPCFISTSDVHVSRSTTRSRKSKRRTTTTSYYVELSYSYTYQGQEYTSDRYTFSNSSFSHAPEAQAIVQQYPKGAERFCYVNPADPGDAVLVRSNPKWTLALMGGILTAFGVCLLLLGLRSIRARKELSARATL
ncbi:MAG: hypothetical protein C5B54_07475 [Acidobacteria bacterium]|nr:MAG: hypothetical protein C5B54_07475 [Acidobacteriota bacterium]